MKNNLFIPILLLVAACTTQKLNQSRCIETDLIYPAAGPTSFGATTPCQQKEARLYLEIGYNQYNYVKDTVMLKAQVQNYFEALKWLYAKAGIPLKLAGIHIWKTPDPYMNQVENGRALLAFAEYNNPKPRCQYDLAQFIDKTTPTRNLSNSGYPGGIGTSARYSWISVGSLYGIPIGVYNGIVKTGAHELAHLCNCAHSQKCIWIMPDGTLGRLDSCASPEQYNGSKCIGGVKPTKNGKVCGYCDGILNGAINWNDPWGPQPTERMRVALMNCASCPCISLGITPCTYDSLCINGQ